MVGRSRYAAEVQVICTSLRGKSARTIDLYIHGLRQVSDYFDTCPSQLSTDLLTWLQSRRTFTTHSSSSTWYTKRC
ncbi:MAG: hypothetical protein CME81_04355 [Halomonas sp.]|nr:hypothetical protein [Halomonas sp.]